MRSAPTPLADVLASTCASARLPAKAFVSFAPAPVPTSSSAKDTSPVVADASPLTWRARPVRSALAPCPNARRARRPRAVGSPASSVVKEPSNIEERLALLTAAKGPASPVRSTFASRGMSANMPEASLMEA